MNCTEDSLLGTVAVDIFSRYTVAEFRAKFLTFPFLLQRYLVPVWITVGIFGNILAFLVWTTPKLRRSNSSAIYLAALSLSDLLLLLLYINVYLTDNWEIRAFTTDLPCQIFNGFFILAQHYAVPLVLLFTLERWISICYPFLRDKLCTPKRALIAAIIAGLFMTIIGFINGLGNVYGGEDEMCKLKDEWTSSVVVRVYLTCVEILLSALLPIVTLVFNILVLRELRRITKSSRTITESAPMILKKKKENASGKKSTKSKSSVTLAATAESAAIAASSSRSREVNSFRSTTVMLLSVSFYLIVSTLPAGALYLFQMVFGVGNQCLSDASIRRDRTWAIFLAYQVIKELFDHLAITHYALNFIIYLTTSAAFRDQAKHILACGRLDKQADMFEMARRRKPRSPYLHRVAEGQQQAPNEEYDRLCSLSLISGVNYME